MTKTFTILGEEFLITPQMERMIKLQSVYRMVSHEHLETFDEDYDSMFQRFEDLLEADQLAKMANQYIYPIIQLTDNVIKRNFNLEMDERAKKELELYYENLKIFKVIDGLKAMCQEMYQEYEQQQQEREWKSRNAPQFMGGGFGITGALKGAFQAELLNMGIRSLNSISNSIGSARTEYKMRKKLDDFFDDPNTKWKIKAVVYEDMIGFYFVAHSIINRKITLREKCFNYDRSDSNQAHELYMRVTNVDAYVSDFKEKTEKLLAEPYSCYTHAMARKAYEAFYEELRNSNARDDIRTLLKLFPMKSSYFKLYFDRVNEIDRDIQAYAEMCGYDVSKDMP